MKKTTHISPGLVDDDLLINGWDVSRDDGFWTRYSPPGSIIQIQGWKIHLSASFDNYQDLLNTVVPLLIKRNIPFKHTSTVENLKKQLSHRHAREAGPKFVTVYPNDEQFESTVEELVRETEGFESPYLWSDLQVSPKAPVYIRYGVMNPQVIYHNVDGSIEPKMVGPMGEYVEDLRKPSFTPPSWAKLPGILKTSEQYSAQIEPPTTGNGSSPERKRDSDPSEIILNSKYRVIEAILHSNRGGVYRGIDVCNGEEVILKEARKGIIDDEKPDGMWARLKRESDLLSALSEHSFPKAIDTFSIDSHLFLVEEAIDGEDLRKYINRQEVRPRKNRLTQNRIICSSVINKVLRVHSDGFVFNDLTPGNIMVVSGTETIRFIDPEFVTRLEEKAPGAFTLGYARPDVVEATKPRDPNRGDDLYSLAMTCIFTLTGVEPTPYFSGNSIQSYRKDRAEWIENLATDFPEERRFIRALGAVLSYIDNDDSNADQAQKLLEEISDSLQCEHDKSLPQFELRFFGSVKQPSILLKELIANHHAATVGLIHDRIETSSSILNWADNTGSFSGDPLSVQYGLGGVTLMAAYLNNLSIEFKQFERVYDKLITAFDDNLGRALPGLYFGRSGTVASLARIAKRLGDRQVVNDQIERMRRFPISWSSIDVTHGLSGLGLAHLDLLNHSHDRTLEVRVSAIWEYICGRIESIADSTQWSERRDEDPSSGAAWPHIGYAHGTAGIAHFLLLYHVATSNKRALYLARAAGDDLLTASIDSNNGLTWPISSRLLDPESATPNWWCSGSVGIASFLHRLYVVTGEESYLTAAREGLLAAVSDRWVLPPAYCHGTSSLLHGLIDHLCLKPDDDRILKETNALIRSQFNRQIRLKEDCALPTESGDRFAIGLGNGLVGSYSAFRRLLDGGFRLGYSDQLLGAFDWKGFNGSGLDTLG